MKKKFTPILFFLFSLFFFSDSVKANYWLVIGTYRQGPGSRPEVSGITSPSLHSIPMKDLDTCKKAGEQISKEIYKQSGNLIVNGLVYLAAILKKVTFSHREHSHHLYNFHFRKSHFLCQSKLLIKRMADLI